MAITSLGKTLSLARKVIVDYAPLSKMFILTIWRLCTEPKAWLIIQIVKIIIEDGGAYAILSVDYRYIEINKFALEG